MIAKKNRVLIFEDNYKFQAYVAIAHGTNYSNIIYNRTVDLCKMGKMASTTRFFQAVYDELKKHSNLTFLCPIKAVSN